MRILTTGTTGECMPPPFGGIPKLSLLYSREWKKMGHEVAVTFVYRPENADDLGADANYFFEYGSRPTKSMKILFLLRHAFSRPLLYVKRFSAYWRIYPRITAEILLYSAYGVWIDGIIASWKPDIIVTEAALIHGFMVGQSARERGIPMVSDTYAEVRDLKMGVNKHLTPQQRSVYWKTHLGLSELIIGMANCSDGPLQYLPPEKVKVFYDTCDFTRSREGAHESMAECRSALRLPQNTFIAGAVGAFSPRKGHDHLIKAVAILRRKGNDVAVALCGAGDPSEWRKLAADEGIADRVFFFQGLSEADLVRLHRSCDIYANLSNSARSCGLDLALLEAMASGCPIVVYDTGALPTAVPSGKNGFVIPANDIEAVAKALAGFIALSQEERTRMGKESAAVAQKCDIQETARIKIGWLEEVYAAYRG